MTTYQNSMATPWTDAWPEIAARCAAPPRLLVACDFDGTLAPLVAHPDDVELPAAALEALRRLREAPGVSLAVVSGRSLADLRQRIPLPDLILAGNHGLEIRGLGLDGERRQATALKPRLRSLASRLDEAVGGVPGLHVENKGLSLTVHLRNVISSHREMVAREVWEIGALDTAFRVQQGHMVLEFIPDIGWDKGSALRQITARLGLPRCAAFYAGDDTTDESAFTALSTGLTVRVGKPRDTAARWTASDPEDIRHLLECLALARRGAGVAAAMALH
jgi:trehalose 6-phosphate phosphatase